MSSAIPNPGSAPNAPFLYVTELTAGVKVVTRDGSVSTFATGLLNYDADGGFPGSGERGITGITVDPANGDVFVGLVYRPDNGRDEFWCKVIRITSNDGGRTAATVTTLVDMQNAPVGPAHQIGALTISPAGYLYIQMGDGFEAETALNLDDWRGKVLRVYRSTGLPVTNNPFYNAGDGITARDYIYAYGVRNPFGAAWRFAEPAMYMVENGPGVDRFTKLVYGRNFGYDGSDESMSTHAIYNWRPSVAPVSLTCVQSARFARSGFAIGCC